VTDKLENKFFSTDENSQAAYPIEKAGWPYIAASAFITFIFALLGFAFLAFIGIAATFFICYFFRDPDKVTPDQDGAVISPADGRVVFTGEVQENPFLDGPCLKIGIFMSVFNVHVNRIPFSGTIKQISYFPGKFFTADKEKASTENEHNALILETKSGKNIGFVQVAGLVARRIICRVKEGQPVICGQRFGLICFGSRVDLYLPADTLLNVKKGDKVTAGASIMGFLQ